MEKAKLYCKAIITWNSGRVEEFSDKLNKSGEPSKKFKEKVEAHKVFPTVRKVEVVRF